MIVQEKILDNLIKTTSDCDLKIRQIETGHIYDSAIDIIPLKYTYEETEEKIGLTEEDYKKLAEEYKTLLDIISGDRSGE